MTTAQRYECAKCGRWICSTDGLTYTSVPDGDGRRFPYVYLRRHVAKPGVWCRGFSARVAGTARAVDER